MTNLLPLNNKIEEQNFAGYIDTQAIADYSSLSVNPLLCNITILPHIAFGYGVSILGMSEKEAREYLFTIVENRTKRGTVQAVEDTLEVVFDKAELVEWFNDDTLKRGEFRVKVTMESDPKLIYSSDRFSLSKRLINEAKNVRSTLKDFTTVLPLAELELSSSASSNTMIEMKTDLEFTITKKINIQGGAFWLI